jgi:hypothetical protein
MDCKTRRAFLKSGGMATLVTLLAGCAPGAATLAGRPTVTASKKKARLKFRPDLLDDNSPRDAEVIQLTSESDVPSSHLYMEAQVFTMDSRRFVLHRSATAHGSSKSDPKHQ